MSIGPLGGLSSGMDTQNMVQQLMRLEAQAMRPMQQRRAEYQAADKAWGEINTRLSSLRSATDTLNDGAWLREAVTADSSDKGVAEATATGEAAPGSVSLDVRQLAQRHQVAYGGGFTSADEVVGEGTLVIDKDGEQIQLDLGQGATVSDLTRAIDGVDGLSAQLLSTSGDQQELIVTADDSGAASQFTIDGSSFASLDDTTQVLRQGQDATIDLGDGTAGGELLVSRSSNQISDLVDGVTLNLRGTGQVTVDVGRDAETAVKAVSDFVDATNKLLDELDSQSRASAEEGSRGPLAGESQVRRLQMDIRGSLSEVVGDGEYATLSSIGIELTRDGRVELDEGALRTAISDDPTAVTDLLGRSASADDARVDITTLRDPQAGDYDLQVTAAATTASLVGDPMPAAPVDEQMTIDVDGQSVDVTVTAAQQGSAQTVADAISQQLADAGIDSVQAGVETVNGDDVVTLTASQAGAGHGFTVSNSGGLGLDGTATGTDAEGTLTYEGETYTLDGNGSSFSVPDGPGRGLHFAVPVEATGDFGTISVDDGLAATMDRVLAQAEGSDGSIQRARDSLESRIESTDQSLERFERRLEMREETLTMQFARMESAMAQAQQQGQWMSGQMGAASLF